MALLLAFGAALLVAVLVSERAQRTVLSTALLFLVVGFVPTTLGWTPRLGDARVEIVVDAALVITLFSDGARLPLEDLRHSLRLPGRALLIGMPLTLLVTAVLARFVVGFGWRDALLVGAALSPTDPVFAASLVGSEHVPLRLRRMLNVESGINDGLALPLVLVLVEIAGGHGRSLADVLIGIVVGVGIGAAVPVLAVWLYRRPFFEASPVYRPIFGAAVLLVTWSLAHVLGGNEFLASFVGGISLATASDDARQIWETPGEALSEVGKLAALFVLGSELTVGVVRDLAAPGAVIAFAILALLVARPLAFAVALVRADLEPAEKVVAGWFGPRGFASVIFALIIRRAEVPSRDAIFGLVAFVVVASVALHSTTDTLVANWFRRQRERRASRTSETGRSEPAEAN